MWFPVSTARMIFANHGTEFSVRSRSTLNYNHFVELLVWKGPPVLYTNQTEGFTRSSGRISTQPNQSVALLDTAYLVMSEKLRGTVVMDRSCKKNGISINKPALTETSWKSHSGMEDAFAEFASRISSVQLLWLGPIASHSSHSCCLFDLACMIIHIQVRTLTGVLNCRPHSQKNFTTRN